jgi:signal transduction histidine kinase
MFDLIDRVRVHLNVVLREPLSRRTRAELLYVVVALPLSVAGFVFVVVSLVLGVWLAITFVGLPLLAASGLTAWWLGSVHRRLARRLLDEPVAAPGRLRQGPGFFGWLQSALRDPGIWRARVYLVVKLPLAVLTMYLAVAFWGIGLFWVTYPLWWQVSGPGLAPRNGFLDGGALVLRGHTATRQLVAHRATVHFGQTYVDTWPRAAALVLAGLVAVFAAPWIVRALVGIDRRLIGALLGPATGAERVRQLEQARAQLVDDAAVQLRRIERDLHDGTQAQLGTLAMTLGQAKEKLEHRPDVPFDPVGAFELVEAAHRHAKEALVELRSIARGIHPPALDVGLDAALATLVARCAIPSVLHTEIPERPTEAIETIAYFSVAELLANAAKYSRARRVRVEVTERDARLCLAVRDDGVGGAAPAAGSGLSGLADRVAAVDGHLHVSSPPGGPTVIAVDLPLHA